MQLDDACDEGGTILALRGHASPIRALIRTNGPTAARNIAQVLSGPIDFPDVLHRRLLMMTNKTSNT